MPQDTPTRRNAREDGYILIGVILLLALFVIAMGVAAPKIAADIQRDRDLETMHRGKQYIRAIKLYYLKFHAYPPSLDALVKQNEIRFLRRKYLDPTTGKDDWKPVMFGQNKTPMAMGFFGQPLGGIGMGGTALAGTGPGGTPGSPIGGGSTGLFAGSGATQSASSTDPSAGAGAGGISGIGGAGGIGGGGVAGATSGTGTTDASGNPTSGSTAGQTFGGAGIIGVTPMSPKQSILVYKKKNHYNEWEFLYSPLSEQQMVTGGGGAGLGQTNGSPGVGAPTYTPPNTGSTPIAPAPSTPPTATNP